MLLPGIHLYGLESKCQHSFVRILWDECRKKNMENWKQLMTRSLNFFHHFPLAAIMMTLRVYGTYWQRYLGRPSGHPKAEYLDMKNKHSFCFFTMLVGLGFILLGFGGAIFLFCQGGEDVLFCFSLCLKVHDRKRLYLERS